MYSCIYVFWYKVTKFSSSPKNAEVKSAHKTYFSALKPIKSESFY